jgi:hypothetical protein
MGWKNTTDGWDKYGTFVLTLRELGILYQEETKEEYYAPGAGDRVNGPFQHLRLARFITPAGTSKVVEEYLKRKTTDCNGQSLIDIAIYEEGSRPALKTKVYDLDDEGETFCEKVSC